ncbi:MAG: glycosyltransferase [Candidatus Synoicihabitans palmerolidicus]|nr:glycosyltransferase [Candidatus Synoicihabitans palmerolidicus]
MYNERFMARRAIAAACALDYPRQLLQIQVLDDSDDDTVDLVNEGVAEARRLGHPVEVIRRKERGGFKAGALAAAMPRVTGEFIAIFDADFVPAPDFLQRMVVQHPAFEDPPVGCLQGRWAHFNRDESRLTRAQRAMHDGHFLIEQVARSGSGLWFNFNGSGGVWRRACIDDAGGVADRNFDRRFGSELSGLAAGMEGRVYAIRHGAGGVAGDTSGVASAAISVGTRVDADGEKVGVGCRHRAAKVVATSGGFGAYFGLLPASIDVGLYGDVAAGDICDRSRFGRRNAAVYLVASDGDVTRESRVFVGNGRGPASAGSSMGKNRT